MDKNKIETNKVDTIIAYCRTELNFEDLVSRYGYKSLPICIVDCIYSLRAKYDSMTIPVVNRYAKQYLNGNKLSSDDTLRNFLQRIEQAGGCENFASKVLLNRQRLAKRNKTEVCYEVADKLFRWLGINTLEEFQTYDKPELLDIVLSSVKGMGDAGINYLYMLAGDSNRCKPDVRIHRFMKDALGADVSNEQCQILLEGAVRELKIEYPKLTVRGLDHLIWTTYGSRK